MSLATFFPKTDKDGDSSSTSGGPNQKRLRKRTTDLEPSPPLHDNSKRLHFEQPPEGLTAVGLDPTVQAVTLFKGGLYRVVKQTIFDVERELSIVRTHSISSSHMRPLGLHETISGAILQRVHSSCTRVEASLSQLALQSQSPPNSHADSAAAASHAGPYVVLAKLQVHLPDTSASTASASASANLPNATVSSTFGQLFDVLSLELCCLLHSVWRESQQTYGGGCMQLSVSFSHAGADMPDSTATCLIDQLLQLVERGYPNEKSLDLLRNLRLVLVPRDALSLRPDMLGVSDNSPDGLLAVSLVNLAWQLFQHPLPLSKSQPSPSASPPRATKPGDSTRAASPSGTGTGTTSFLFYSTPFNDSPRNPTPSETSAVGSHSVRPAASRVTAAVREEPFESSPTAASSDSDLLPSPSNKRLRLGASPRTGRDAGEAAEANAPSDAPSTRFLEFACK